MARIRMYTTTSCSDCRSAKRFLAEKGIAFEEINIEEISGADQVVIQATGGKRSVPTFDIDGYFITLSPFDPKKLAESLRLGQGV
jgi:mycoredoxin